MKQTSTPKSSVKESQNSDSNSIAKLREMTDGIKYVMLTTIDEEGSLFSRPMTVQELDDSGVFWFFTGRTTGQVSEIKKDQHINLSFALPKDSRFVSVSGVAEVINDIHKAKELWSPLLKAFFPQGLEDPNLTLLKVTPVSAEYWDSPSATVVKILGAAKAVLKGEAYEGGENEKLHFTH